MPIRKREAVVSLAIMAWAFIFAGSAFSGEPARDDGPLPAWREDFIPAPKAAPGSLPGGWRLEKKPGTRPAVFSVKTDSGQAGHFLHMDADAASASLIAEVKGVDITKTPLLRWRWRAVILPEGADGRIAAADDQAIGIYVGSGKIWDNRSVSYRWDTLTPGGAGGNAAYGMGAVKVRWYTLRNREDLNSDRWFIEERDVARDFKDAWGFYPEKIYVSVSCNSQYTKSRAAADLDWIEFIAAPPAR